MIQQISPDTFKASNGDDKLIFLDEKILFNNVQDIDDAMLDNIFVG